MVVTDKVDPNSLESLSDSPLCGMDCPVQWNNCIVILVPVKYVLIYALEDKTCKHFWEEWEEKILWMGLFQIH